jgi:hypothetical protein
VSSTVMIQSDNMSMQMTSNKLDGTNYSAWSQFVQLYVTRKGKLGYLIGEKIKPAISDPSFSTWVENVIPSPKGFKKKKVLFKWVI